MAMPTCPPYKYNNPCPTIYFVRFVKLVKTVKLSVIFNKLIRNKGAASLKKPSLWIHEIGMNEIRENDYMWFSLKSAVKVPRLDNKSFSPALQSPCDCIFIKAFWFNLELLTDCSKIHSLIQLFSRNVSKIHFLWIHSTSFSHLPRSF